MIALDTNVLARAIATEIDADAATKAQRKRAQALLSSGQQLFVPVTVIEELEWVLRGAYDMAPDDIAAVFEDMLAIETLTIPWEKNMTKVVFSPDGRSSAVTPSTRKLSSKPAPADGTLTARDVTVRTSPSVAGSTCGRMKLSNGG